MGSKGLNKPLLLLRMGNSFYRVVLALVLLGSGQFVFAQNYYWKHGSTGIEGISPISVCSAAHPDTTLRLREYGDNRFWCEVLRQADNYWMQAGYVVRYGSTCPRPDDIYNPATGDCDPAKETEPNQCQSKIGQSHSFGGDMGQMETCVDKCIVVVDASSSDPVATYKKPGDISKTYWWVTGIFSGEECAASDGTDNNPPAPTESASDSECTPTTTTDDGSQVSTCTETKVEVDNQGCVAKGGSVGSVNGVMQCVAANKGPKANETKTTTKTETTTKPDGSKTEKTTKTTEQKNCSGAGACSSNTTTNVNNSTTNADGTKGGESSSCTGANCTGDGKGDGSGSGDGKGEGDGEGEGEEEGEGPPGPEGTLKQGEGGDFSEGITEWDQRITDVRADLDQKLGEYSSLFKGVFDLDLGTGGGSLPCENIPISFGTTTTNLRFCLADYSDPLSYLRYALLLGAAALAAVIILRG
ncbi:hypothetical protein [Phytopseudomonas seleniipraecipitans]|nr:hypothetical protein [Pseudomonas seleniipraecipitans]